ncbi:expressed unknown protein [Seminavis robusta]|uniref:Uncharacterized protein n=1 Tax=Seminavis robusta TaxID=568900 RepID=A0A9N8DEX3_9STRA|nr:expressed unknown protein [Seminavis robusta]|eukprot:Sro38_g023700.1 n/a (214) ;mRNA; f:64465-65106
MMMFLLRSVYALPITFLLLIVVAGQVTPLAAKPNSNKINGGSNNNNERTLVEWSWKWGGPGQHGTSDRNSPWGVSNNNNAKKKKKNNPLTIVKSVSTKIVQDPGVVTAVVLVIFEKLCQQPGVMGTAAVTVGRFFEGATSWPGVALTLLFLFHEVDDDGRTRRLNRWIGGSMFVYFFRCLQKTPDRLWGSMVQGAVGIALAIQLIDRIVPSKK